MNRYEQRIAGTPLTDEEKRQVNALADLPEADIDLSDLPESTPEQLRSARLRCSPNAGTRLDKAS